MKNKLFGAYLVERGVLTEAELVNVLIQQLKTIPAVAEVVIKNSLLSSSKVLAIFDYQSANNIDFINAAKELRFWNSEIESKCEEVIRSEKILLGEILISRGLVTAQALINILDEYINDSEISTVVTTKQSLSNEPLHDEVNDFFSPVRYEKLISEFQTAELDIIVKHIREIRGRAYLAKWRRLNAILAGVEEALKINSNTSQANLDVRTLAQDSISLAWDIVHEWKNGLTEEDFFKSSIHATAISFLIRRIGMQKQRNVS